MTSPEEQTLVQRLRTRVDIRRNIQSRKAVQEGKPDRISALLDEAAERIESFEVALSPKLAEMIIPIQINVSVCTALYGDEIHQQLWINSKDSETLLHQEVYNLAEKGIRDALIKKGWAPPDDFT